MKKTASKSGNWAGVSVSVRVSVSVSVSEWQCMCVYMNIPVAPRKQFPKLPLHHFATHQYSEIGTFELKVSLSSSEVCDVRCVVWWSSGSGGGGVSASVSSMCACVHVCMSSCTCTTTGGGRGWKAQSSKSRKRGASKLSKLMSSSSNHTRLRGEWREGGREGGREGVSGVCEKKRDGE